jgi:WD40 repeat protein
MTLQGHTGTVLCVTQLTDGRLVSGGFDGTIKIWNTISGIYLMDLEGHTEDVNCMTQLTDGRLVTGSDDSTIKLWDTILGSCLMTMQGHIDYVRCVTQLTDGRLVSGSDDMTIKIWNIMSLSQQKWIRRRLLVLLFEASKILIDSPELDMINPEQYRCRHQDLELLLRCSLNISNNNNNINLKAFKITLTVLSMPEIAILIAEYL